MLFFWNVFFEYDKVLSFLKCLVCFFLFLFYDESLCSFFWYFFIFIVDIVSGFYGIFSFNFLFKYFFDKINFFIVIWIKVVEWFFFFFDDVLGIIKKKKKVLCLYFGENMIKVCENIVFVKEMNVRCLVY